MSNPTPPSAPKPGPRAEVGSFAPPTGAERSPGAAGLGPLVLLLPILALLGFTLWRQVGGDLGRTQPTSTERPPSARGERVVDGWAGSFTVPGDAPFVVEARLAPLHADPARQAFDAAALAERLGLPAGAPWRLALTARAVVAPGPATEQQPPPLPLDGLALSGFQGLSQGTSAPDPGAGAERPPRLDPLRTLLAPPRGGLAPGSRVDLVFWRPRGGAAAGPTACTLSAGYGDAVLEVVLTPTRLAEPGTSESLARLPAAAPEERGR